MNPRDIILKSNKNINTSSIAKNKEKRKPSHARREGPQKISPLLKRWTPGGRARVAA